MYTRNEGIEKLSKEELIALVDTLANQRQNLSDERKHLERRIAEDTARLKAIYQRHWDLESGELLTVSRKLEEAKVYLSDADAPKPVWIGDRGYYDVISRITPKRVYLRKAGSDREEFFSRETGYQGRGEPYGAQLDVQATIAAWNAAKAVKS